MKNFRQLFFMVSLFCFVSMSSVRAADDVVQANCTGVICSSLSILMSPFNAGYSLIANNPKKSILVCAALAAAAYYYYVMNSDDQDSSDESDRCYSPRCYR